MGEEEIISAKDLYMRFQKMLRKSAGGISDDIGGGLAEAAGIREDELGKPD